MLGINKFKRGVMTATKSLRNLEGLEVTLNAGEHVNLLALTSGLFAIQNKLKGTIVLPEGLFAGDFKLFQKGI